MPLKVSISISDRVSKFVQTLAEAEQKEYPEIIQSLLEKNYDREVEKFYTAYLRGEITLRAMARRLGLSYRELYQLLADKGLPL